MEAVLIIGLLKIIIGICKPEDNSQQKERARRDPTVEEIRKHAQDMGPWRGNF